MFSEALRGVVEMLGIPKVLFSTLQPSWNGLMWKKTLYSPGQRYFGLYKESLWKCLPNRGVWLAVTTGSTATQRLGPRGGGHFHTGLDCEPEIEEVCGHTEVTSVSLRCTSHQWGVMGKWPHHSITWCTSVFWQRYIKRGSYSCTDSRPTLHQSNSTFAPVHTGTRACEAGRNSAHEAGSNQILEGFLKLLNPLTQTTERQWLRSRIWDFTFTKLETNLKTLLFFNKLHFYKKKNN